eukprot:TRINITY_DN31470_c0_g1_i1.p1 TRINITY_DN31470_c0_g1~~TRINITY_DN31470_c0_g1_i1.p1  ORF type:complete len:775 (+),score=146.15 TRINITY_DN31470_c0_g1_i1:141-2465(+)
MHSPLPSPVVRPTVSRTPSGCFPGGGVSVRSSSPHPAARVLPGSISVKPGPATSLSSQRSLQENTQPASKCSSCDTVFVHCANVCHICGAPRHYVLKDPLGGSCRSVSRRAEAPQRVHPPASPAVAPRTVEATEPRVVQPVTTGTTVPTAATLPFQRTTPIPTLNSVASTVLAASQAAIPAARTPLPSDAASLFEDAMSQLGGRLDTETQERQRLERRLHEGTKGVPELEYQVRQVDKTNQLRLQEHKDELVAIKEDVGKIDEKLNQRFKTEFETRELRYEEAKRAVDELRKEFKESRPEEQVKKLENEMHEHRMTVDKALASLTSRVEEIFGRLNALEPGVNGLRGSLATLEQSVNAKIQDHRQALEEAQSEVVRKSEQLMARKVEPLTAELRAQVDKEVDKSRRVEEVLRSQMQNQRIELDTLKAEITNLPARIDTHLSHESTRRIIREDAGRLVGALRNEIRESGQEQKLEKLREDINKYQNHGPALEILKGKVDEMHRELKPHQELHDHVRSQLQEHERARDKAGELGEKLQKKLLEMQERLDHQATSHTRLRNECAEASDQALLNLKAKLRAHLDEQADAHRRSQDNFALAVKEDLTRHFSMQDEQAKDVREKLSGIRSYTEARLDQIQQSNADMERRLRNDRDDGATRKCMQRLDELAEQVKSLSSSLDTTNNRERADREHIARLEDSVSGMLSSLQDTGAAIRHSGNGFSIRRRAVGGDDAGERPGALPRRVNDSIWEPSSSSRAKQPSTAAAERRWQSPGGTWRET